MAEFQPAYDPAARARPRRVSFARWLWHGRGRRKPWLRRLIVALFVVVFLVPLALAAVYRVLPVPGTPLMLFNLPRDGLPSYDWVPLREISANMVKAAIASEDAKFCSHFGFDLQAIEQALEANSRGGRLRGGSTISQQTAKNLFLPPSRTWARKGFEAYYTVALEVLWPKWRILEAYLNIAELGPGIYGVEAAAQHYYKKPARNLSVTEAARLASVLPSPRNYKVVNPGPYVRRRTGQIAANMGIVTRDRLDACVTDYR